MILLSDNPSIEVAAYEVTQHFGNIDAKKLRAEHPGNSQKIEGVGNGVGKTAEDEYWYAKE